MSLEKVEGGTEVPQRHLSVDFIVTGRTQLTGWPLHLGELGVLAQSTREASVDPVVTRPEPENGITGTFHLVHGCCSHLLKMVGTVSAAEEGLHIASHGLQDLLAVSWFLWVGLTVSVCLHSQEVEEDPQGAGESPEMWLTALATNPVHLLSKDSVLLPAVQSGFEVTIGNLLFLLLLKPIVYGMQEVLDQRLAREVLWVGEQVAIGE